MWERKIICNKDNITLFKEISENDITFIIDFMMSNKFLNLKEAINHNIFELLYTLNKDIFETFHIIEKNEEQNYIDMFISYKHYGAEYGIPKTCTCFRLYYSYIENGITFSSKSIECPEKILPSERYEFIKDKGMHTSLKYSNDNNSVYVKCTFTMENDLRIPIFMENMPGKLMKNVYLRLKTFIENLTNNN